MNKTLTDKLFGGIQSFWQNLSNNTGKFIEQYDIASMPSFVMFTIVVTAGLTVNYFFLAPIVGSIEAGAISLMFEIGILAWKFQGHRIKNSASQKQIVGWAMWLSAGLAFSMLIATLTESLDWRWVVAIAAAVHIVCYLLFDQNDDIRENMRKNAMAMEGINQKNKNADYAIQEAEADLKIIDKITTELTRLRNQYGHLPIDELEFVLETYRARLLVEYKASVSVDKATKKLSDVDGNGRVNKAPQNAPRQAVTALASQVPDYVPTVTEKAENAGFTQGQEPK